MYHRESMQDHKIKNQALKLKKKKKRKSELRSPMCQLLIPVTQTFSVGDSK